MNPDNVEKSNQNILDKALEDLNNILGDQRDNITDTEKKLIDTTIVLTQKSIGSLDQVKNVEDQISTLPDAESITKGNTDAVSSASNAFDDLSTHEKTLIDSTLISKLDNVTKALLKMLLQDLSTGVKLDGIEGTTFDVNTELVVTPIMGTLDNNIKNLFEVNVNNAESGKKIVQLYDIHLLLNGEHIQPGGKVKITLKLSDEQKKYTNLQVVYIADNGDVTIIPYEQSEDEIVFYTTHFSNYGIIGTPINTVNNSNVVATGDNIFHSYGILVSISLVIFLGAFRKKSRFMKKNHTL